MTRSRLALATGLIVIAGFLWFARTPRAPPLASRAQVQNALKVGFQVLERAPDSNSARWMARTYGYRTCEASPSS